MEENLSPLCIHTNPGESDLIIWKDSIDGDFSVASCYSWLLHQRNDGDNVVAWAWIWKAVVPEKVRFFAWQALLTSIPVAAELAHRGIPVCALCNLCSVGPESALHCLRDCEDSRRVWSNLALSLAPTFFTASSFADWLASVPRTDGPSLLIHAWFLWCRRCSFVFDGVKEPWQMVLHNAASVLRVLRSAPVTGTDPRWVAWRAPPDGWAALNVDGSSLGNPGRAGAGGVIRNNLGVWCSGFSAHVGITEILKAELLAILFGLRLCWDRGFRRIVVFSDSTLAISLVSHGCGRFHVYGAVIGLIREFLERDWMVRLEHILREGNAVADCMAKEGARGSDRLKLWESPPVAALPLLADDYRGTFFFRS